VDIQKTFSSFAEWLEFFHSGALLQPEQIDELGQLMENSGAIEPLTQSVIEGNGFGTGAGWREGLAWRGVNSRSRAVLLLIEEVLGGAHDPRIFAAEGLTGFALRLRGLFPRFIGSEYTEDPKVREYMFPIPFEDLQSLSFGENLFDLVSTNEVLEHVPSIDLALSEICRVLRPGGWHIGTHPFYFLNEQSLVRAVIRDGELVHLLEPEYHGNPMSNQGALVFEIPGWDILDRAKKAGFSKAEMRFVISTRHACLADHTGGVFVLCCQK
jgi:SAM-dependent methyltransferase